MGPAAAAGRRDARIHGAPGAGAEVGRASAIPTASSATTDRASVSSPCSSSNAFGRRACWVSMALTAAGLSYSFLNQPIEIQALRPCVAGLLGTYEAPQVVIRVGRRRAGQPAPSPAVRRPVREVLLDAGPA